MLTDFDDFVDAIYEGQVWVNTHTSKEIAEKYLGEELPHIVFSNFM